MTDAELVTRTRNGDSAAFGQLVARYYDACWRFAYSMLGERADAEDVIQESFLRAYLALNRYDERDQFRGWLFRILTNQCRNALTSRGRRSRRFIQDEVAIEGAPAPPEPPVVRVWVPPETARVPVPLWNTEMDGPPAPPPAPPPPPPAPPFPPLPPLPARQQDLDPPPPPDPPDPPAPPAVPDPPMPPATAFTVEFVTVAEELWA